MAENTLILKLRGMQHRVIDQAFSFMSQADRERYKRYFIEIKGNSKSIGGCYEKEKKKITLKNATSYTPVQVFFISLHELAHHIECIQRGATDHADGFYKIYKVLLYAAFDLEYLNKNDLYWYSENAHLSDGKKIFSYAAKYSKKQEPPLVESKAVISCYNSYLCKDALKGRGYIYNALDKCWIKEISLGEVEAEKNILKSIMPEKDIAVSSRFVDAIRKYREIEVTGDTYSHRDELKERGYKYSDGKWRKRVIDADIKNEVEFIQQMKYVYSKLI